MKNKIQIAFIFVLGSTLLYAGIVAIPNMAKSRIETMLGSAGFSGAVVDDVAMRISGIRANDIKLDESGLDTIKTFDMDLNWPIFLMNGEIKSLSIKDVTISRTSEEMSVTSRKLLEKLMSLPDFRLHVSNVIIGVSTLFGDIRMRMEGSIDSAEEPLTRQIKARVAADQYQLGFNSEWEGKINQKGILDISGNILDGRLNMGPLRVSRFNGWIAAGIDAKGYSTQGQLEAGSAMFMDVPLQTISLVHEISSKQATVSARGGVSGMPDVRLTADLSATDKQQNFTAILKGNNLGGFLDFIDQETGAEKVISQGLIEKRNFELTGAFQPDRRFVGGPLPFAITLNTDGEELMEGNILFYPDTMDVRGALETDTETALAMKNCFKIPSENVKQNFIRLDGDARRLFVTQKETKTP